MASTYNYVNVVTVDYLLSCLVKLVKIYSLYSFFSILPVIMILVNKRLSICLKSHCREHVFCLSPGYCVRTDRRTDGGCVYSVGITPMLCRCRWHMVGGTVHYTGFGRTCQSTRRPTSHKSL